MKKQILVFIIVVVVLLVAAWIIQSQLSAMKVEQSITSSRLDVLRPDEMAGTLLIGGFRGVAINVLWLQAVKLEEEKKYYEIPAICLIITKVQPNIASAWIFNAFNFAYNISILWNDPKEAWNWVKQGIDFLTDGIKRNPDNYYLKSQLGWFFFHKCGDVNADPRASYYREQVFEIYDKPTFLVAADLFEQAKQLYYEDPRDIGTKLVLLRPYLSYYNYLKEYACEVQYADKYNYYPTRVKEEYLKDRPKEVLNAISKCIIALADYLQYYPDRQDRLTEQVLLEKIYKDAKTRVVQIHPELTEFVNNLP